MAMVIAFMLIVFGFLVMTHMKVKWGVMTKNRWNPRIILNMDSHQQRMMAKKQLIQTIKTKSNSTKMQYDANVLWQVSTLGGGLLNVGEINIPKLPALHWKVVTIHPSKTP